MGDIEEVQFGDPLILAEFSIGELRSLYHEAKNHFDLRLAGLEARSKNVSLEDEESDYLAVWMEDVEGFLDLIEHFGVIGAYRTLEIFLSNVVDQLRKGGFIEGKTERYLDGLKDQLKEIGVDLTRRPFRWQAIKKLQKIRNCIAHNEGWVDKRNVSKLKGCGLSVQEGHCLKLPKGYFLEASQLVYNTCQLVTENCRGARKQRRHWWTRFASWLLRSARKRENNEDS
jgi:hypothetical protein